jgi:hypothetical protein
MPRKLVTSSIAVVCFIATSGCNIQPFVALIQDYLIPPRAVAVTNRIAFINPGQTFELDGSASGIVTGSGAFLPAAQVDMTFEWTIVEAFDSVTHDAIDLAATGAALTNGNTSAPTFSANTPADYNVQLTVTAGTLTASVIVGIRVL